MNSSTSYRGSKNLFPLYFFCSRSKVVGAGGGGGGECFVCLLFHHCCSLALQNSGRFPKDVHFALSFFFILRGVREFSCVNSLSIRGMSSSPVSVCISWPSASDNLAFKCKPSVNSFLLVGQFYFLDYSARCPSRSPYPQKTTSVVCLQ